MGRRDGMGRDGVGRRDRLDGDVAGNTFRWSVWVECVWVECVGGVCGWSVWVECVECGRVWNVWVECVGGVCGEIVGVWMWSVKCEDRLFGVCGWKKVT